MMDIIFWLDSMPQVCKGVFNAVSEKWINGNTYYVIAKKMNEDRKLINSTADFGNASTVFLYDNEDYISAGKKFVNTHINGFHIFNGYKSGTKAFLDYLIQHKSTETKIIIWAESVKPNWKQSFPFLLFHYRYAIHYRNKIDAFLPLGTKGVKEYRKLGWPENIMYPFLYLPIMPETIEIKENDISSGIRFVYVGRFSKSKGVEILTEAIDIVKEKNYHVDFVGGYGPIKDKIIEWCAKSDRADFIGTWPIDEACYRLSEYDVCIVPSLYEGWNVTVNEALMSCVGCIVSDETISDELVVASNAGLVVKAGSSKSLAKAIEHVLIHPELINTWKVNALQYRKNMSASICGDYFIDILNYIVTGEGEKPKAPWLVQAKN